MTPSCGVGLDLQLVLKFIQKPLLNIYHALYILLSSNILQSYITYHIATLLLNVLVAQKLALEYQSIMLGHLHRIQLDSRPFNNYIHVYIALFYSAISVVSLGHSRVRNTRILLQWNVSTV